MRFKLLQETILYEGTDYVKTAKERLKVSSLFSNITDSDKDKYANDIVDELRNGVSSLKSNQASKYVLGIIRMVIDSNNWDDAQDILADTGFLNQSIPYIVNLKIQNKPEVNFKEIDEGIMRKWSFKEFKDWFSPIQKDLEKNDVYKQLEQPKSNYDLVSINSYQQLNNLAGASTGDGQNAGSAWCHSIGKTTYDAWVKKGANKFFVLVHKNYKNIKATKGENCPKDEYGLSLMALLVEVETGKLLNCTLRWNHVNTPTNADNQFTYSELS